jgi:uroporphyrinogen decarboxylase
MAEMTKRERVKAAIKGEPMDRVPICYYNHRHDVEFSPDKLLDALLQHNQLFGWDFIKVMLRASYYMEAWGNTYTFDPANGPILQNYVIKKAEDYTKLAKLDPATGPFGEQVEVARRLGEALQGRTPYIQTVFSPLTIAGRLAGSKYGAKDETMAIRSFMESDADALHYGLNIITQTLMDYVRLCIKAGADGLFFTTTAYATFDVMTEEEYRKFGLPYDKAVLEASNDAGGSINALHLCRENIMFDLLESYPVQIINYEATSPRNLTFKAAMKKTSKALWGGMDQRDTLPLGSPEMIAEQTRLALEQTQGKRFVLGPGCTNVYRTVSDENLMAMKKAAREWWENRTR